MKKNFQIKKFIFSVLLFAALMLHAVIPESFPVFARIVIQETSISMDSVEQVTADTAKSILHLNGTADTTYNIPINITANCTVILDHIDNTADITVADGVTAKICLMGDNKINNLLATGGSETSVTIYGNSRLDTLTANDIACSTESENCGTIAPESANIQISSCSITCNRLSSGDDATDRSYYNGIDWICKAPQGGNASPQVLVDHANLVVQGNMACGGNGIYSYGYWATEASAGGSAGAVTIQSSTVSVAGNLSMGGKGGNGVTDMYTGGCVAGTTKSAAPVTITDDSTVTVEGNVATQHSLPEKSQNGTQAGLDGVTVSVSDSILTAKDIASGGNGHLLTKEYKDLSTRGGYYYNYIGTDGGNGGTLIATNAQITCQTAVCGGSAGEYRDYHTDSTGSIYGNPSFDPHPLDGDGGSIQADHSVITISDYACERGTRWCDEINPASYSDSCFIGGILSGTVYGKRITTELTSIPTGGFKVTEGIRDMQENSCIKCVFNTSEEMGYEDVFIKTDRLEANGLLSEDGALITYLPVGLQSIRISGIYSYYGDVEIKGDEAENVFLLSIRGLIDPASGDVIINADNYSQGSDSYTYDGNYTVHGTGIQNSLSVTSGSHVIRLDEVTLDTLSITGSSIVCLELTSQSSIRAVNVASDASLTVSGSGCLISDTIGNENGANGTIVLQSGRIQTNVLGGTTGGKEIFVTDPDSLSASQVFSTVRDTSGAVIAGPNPSEENSDPTAEDTSSGENQSSSGGDQSSSGENQSSSETKQPDNSGSSENTEAVGSQGNNEIKDSGSSQSNNNTQSGNSSQNGNTSQNGNVSQSGNSSQNGNASQSGNASQNGNSLQNSNSLQNGNSSQNANSTQSDSTKNQTASLTETGNKTAAPSAEPVAPTAVIPIQSSMKEMSLIAQPVRNVYQIFTRDKVSLSVKRSEGTTYYYKIVQKGQKNTDVAWKELLTDTVTTEDTNLKQRIFLKAVTADTCIVRKTPGFMVDTRMPEVKGVKSGTFYKDSRSITVSDNSGKCSVTLNGKQMERTFTVQKKGIYLLVVSDAAGNKRTMLFAIL